RCYGISSIRPNVFTAYLQQSGIVSDMMQYSLLDTRPEEFFDEFEKHSVSIVARGAMAQGLLLDKVVDKSYLDHNIEEVQVVKGLVTHLGDKYGVGKQAIALKYCLEKPVVCSALVGIRTFDQLAQLQQSYTDYLKIADKDMHADFSTLRKIRYREHR
ncbi:aldo/keto reductase, partial [Parapusillimonas sp. SGNA-6]|nr:aldo/keto reductase [Parapusillimonas sp. SGNA-6]